MLALLALVIVLVSASTERFKVTTDSGTTSDALRICQRDGRCDPIEGCCSGHGTCNVGSGVATCSCSTGLDCSDYYTGTTCSATSSAPNQGCCSGKSFLPSGSCTSKTQDPEKGSQNSLFKRTSSTPASTSWSDTVENIVSALSNSPRNVTSQKGNMLGLAMFEVAVEDTASYDFSTTTLTAGSTSYKQPNVQANTGITWSTSGLSSTSVPKAFASNGSMWVDAHPLYNFVARRTSSGKNLPYVDASDTSALVAYWNSRNFYANNIVILQFLGEHHNLMAQLYEQYYCGQYSGTTYFSYSTCTHYNSGLSDQANLDVIFEKARRGTIRVWQALVARVALPTVLGINNEPFFDAWFRRDVARKNEWGDPVSALSSVRVGKEFTTQTGRTEPGRMRLAAGLNYVLSMREPVSFAGLSQIGSVDCTGASVSTVAHKMIKMRATQVRTFGSQIHSSFADELRYNILLGRALELESYNTHLAAMNGGLAAATTDHELFYGVHLETRSTHITTASINAGTNMVTTSIPSVVVALYAGISDAIMMDRTSVLGTDSSGYSTAEAFYPEGINVDGDPYNGGADHGCFMSGGVCTSTSELAYFVLTGQPTDNTWSYMDDISNFGNYDARPRGMIWSKFEAKSSGEGFTMSYNLHHSVINTLFYKSTLDTVACYQNVLSSAFIDNGVSDCITQGIGWNVPNYDGKCCNVGNALRCRPSSIGGC